MLNVSSRRGLLSFPENEVEDLQQAVELSVIRSPGWYLENVLVEVKYLS
jgi:hypothetical protein